MMQIAAILALTDGGMQKPKLTITVPVVAAGSMPPKVGWHTDGTPATAADLAWLADNHSTVFHHPGDPDFYTLGVVVDGALTGDAKLFAPGGDCAPFGSLSEGHARSFQDVEYMVPSGLKTMTTRIGVATGPRRLVAHDRMRSGPLHVEATDSGWRRLENHHRHKRWYPISSLVHVTIPDSLVGEDIKLVAYNLAGKLIQNPEPVLITSIDFWAFEPPTMKHRSFPVEALPKEISRVELQARPIQWNTFKDIQLQPRKPAAPPPGSVQK